MGPPPTGRIHGNDRGTHRVMGPAVSIGAPIGGGPANHAQGQGGTVAARDHLVGHWETTRIAPLVPASPRPRGAAWAPPRGREPSRGDRIRARAGTSSGLRTPPVEPASMCEIFVPAPPASAISAIGKNAAPASYLIRPPSGPAGSRPWGSLRLWWYPAEPLR